MGGMREKVLEVVDIWKAYGSLQVLKGVSFDVRESEIKVIFGPSGAGKSTLLRCINMLTPPDRGEVFLRGESVTRARDVHKMRARIGMVFQHFNLFNHLTALDNVAIALRVVKKLPKAEARRRALEALRRVRMEEWASHYPAQLSGGQKQRVAIARAIAMEPDIILFDEPTSALDPELIDEVLQVMLDLARDGTTMLVVTHELDFARAVADEMMFLDSGVIVERGSPEQMLTSPKSERVKAFLRKIERLELRRRERLARPGV